MKSNPIRTLAFTTLILFYGLLVGGTYNGILTPELKILNMGLVTVGLIVWLVARRRSGWAWRRSPLDRVMLLWAAAFAISLIANLDMWRRIALALWYVGMYIVVWFALYDLIINGAIKRDTLIDAFLIGGVFVVYIGFLQFYNGLSAGLDFNLLRPVSLLGNANTLAGYLVILLPFVFERIGSRRMIPRLAMTFYAVFGVLLLLLTFSRGGWIGFAAGLAARFGLYIYERSLHTAAGRREAWSKLTAAGKILIAGIGVGTAAGGVAAIIFLAASLNIAGRTLDLRTFIYDSAITLFTEKPITGWGLFTFGAGLARLNSTPPTEVHSHAHNIFLQVGAEMGVIGLIALVVTLIAIALALRVNLAGLDARDKRIFRAGVASLAAYGVHHLLDFPSMMPTIFLSMMIVLVVTTAPPSPLPPMLPSRQRLFTLAAGIGAILLILTGWFGTITYAQYVGTLRGVTVSNAGERADQLQTVIDFDASMPVYWQEQGYLYAVAGNYPRAVAAWERYTQLAPDYSAGWANLSAVYAAMGRYDDAVSTMQQAMIVAPGMTDLNFAMERYRTAAQTGQPPPILPRQSADPFGSDIPFDENIDPIQFLRIALPRQFLPLLGIYQ